MHRLVAGLLLSLAAIHGCAPPAPATPDDAELRAELAAARDLLRTYGGHGVVRGDTADVSATVGFPDARGSGRRGYETVRYRLERRDGGWRVRERTQLGIS
jgi:hypothetical protein